MAAWERCARKLPVNSPNQLLELGATVTKIVENCIKHPAELKYRRLRSNNATLKSKVLDAEGGNEVMLLLGFSSQLIDGEKYFILGQLPSPDSSSSSSSSSELPQRRTDRVQQQQEEETIQATLTKGLDWLNKNIDVCLEMSAARGASSDEVCAECVVQLLLPTAAAVCGGFMCTDVMRSVLSFAKCHFTGERYPIY